MHYWDTASSAQVFSLATSKIRSQSLFRVRDPVRVFPQTFLQRNVSLLCVWVHECMRDRALFTASIQRRETTGSTLHPSHLLNEHRSDPSLIICVLHCPRLEGKNQGLKSQTEDGGRQRVTILKPGRILFGIFLSFSTDFRPLRTLDEKC